MTTTHHPDPNATYSGLVTSLPPHWAPVNGARGSRRFGTITTLIVHDWESPEDAIGRYQHQLATPATPAAGRALQSSKNGVPLWLATDGTATVDKSAAALDAKGQPIPWTYGPGYLCLADGQTGEFHMSADPDLVKAFANPPLNDTSVNICCPGRARQSRAEWLDSYSRNQIRAIAKFAVYAHQRWGVALHRLTPAELKAGRSGYAGHADITAAFGPPGGHTDPGPNFPWDVLADDIDSLTGEADMAQVVQIYDDKTWQLVTPDTWLLYDGHIEQVPAARLADLVAEKSAKYGIDGKPVGMFRSKLPVHRLVGACPAPYTPSEFLQ